MRATASSSTVSAGAPVKPASASSAALTPVIAPQPDPSLSIVGWSMHRIIWLRGPWYSAIPSASRRCRSSRRQSRFATEATPRAFQAPEVW